MPVAAIIVLNVMLAASADTVATLWAKKEAMFSLWFWLLLILSPAVFFSFGSLASRTGLSIASATANTLLVVTSITIGLVFFAEWRHTSLLQYTGMIMSVAGIVLMLFFPKGD